MKIAYTCWTWLTKHKDNYQYEFEQSLKEVADLGYDSVENFAFITEYFDNDAAAVNKLLKTYKLDLVNMYHHLSLDAETDYQKAVKYIPFMKQTNTKFMNLQCPTWSEEPFDRPTDESVVKGFAQLANRIGKLCAENGIRACMHPHAKTPIFKEKEIDIFLENINPEWVSLCIDTAHSMVGGMEPVAAFRKYGKRIAYVHLKDIDPDPDIDPNWPSYRFRPLGMGVIDFKGVYRELLKTGYDGVLCVELDRPMVCNYKSAMLSREYIRSVLEL